MLIVCVDDHPIVLKGLAQEIQHILPEATIYTFKNVDAALDFVRDNGCDVLISEIELHGTNGLTFARKVKELYPEVNIIFLTVCDEKEHASEVFDISPSGYLLKPAGKEQLACEFRNLRYCVPQMKVASI